jgi:CBS-domain-containing membrane protein
MNPTKQAGAEALVRSIMTTDFVVVRDTIGIDLLAKGLLHRGVSCAAVANARGIVVGYVSMVDLVREHYMNGFTNDGPARRRLRREELKFGFHVDPVPTVTARDIMMPFVVRLPDTATIDEAAALMASEGLHRLLVTSPAGTVVGIVSALDVLRWVAERDGYAVGQRTTWRRACEYAT